MWGFKGCGLKEKALIDIFINQGFCKRGYCYSVFNDQACK
jgi:hypothetical protein